MIHVHTSTYGKDVKLSKNRWHHLAFTQYSNYLNLYLDGKLISRELFQTYVGFHADETLVGLTYFGRKRKEKTLIDEVAFFQTGFSPYEVKNSKTGLKVF